MSCQLSVIPDVVCKNADTFPLQVVLFQIQPDVLIVKKNLDCTLLSDVCHFTTAFKVCVNLFIYFCFYFKLPKEKPEKYSVETETVTPTSSCANGNRSSCHVYTVPSSYYNLDAGNI